uniref:T-cell-specific surface glycoprotein CD28 n=1 Tax=Semicossyphus pulcher TaxID=241346 RepID=UPI0037E9BC53
MKVCWMFMILVGCRLARAKSENASNCNDNVRNFCVPAGDRVSVPCPDLTGEDFEFKLFKDKKNIYNHTCSHDKNKPNCTAPYTRGGVELHQKNNSITFMLTGVNKCSHGVYRCEGRHLFPPPILPPKCGAVNVRVLVEGHQCKMDKCVVEAEKREKKNVNSAFSWIWILVILPVIYSVIMTVLASVFWVKLKKTDTQSDYMNTKPRAPRDRKKNRGVQNPTPRYF